MKKEYIKRDREKENQKEIEKKKKEEWHKKEKEKIIEQRKEYMSYIKGEMHKKGFNSKLRKDKFL
ncbi:MAG: hypothetical protein U9N03_00340, partial [Candidatus Caldatribacteriota bacterium]|nr:hypothetical protein [Candidatus Caldatribacteriota bacterium]